MKKEENTQLIVQLRDGFHSTPVEHARVVVAQTGKAAITDGEGRTSAFYITAWDLPHENLPHRLQTPWQEVTLLVYHEQYVDTVLLHVMLEEGEQNTVTIELFQKSDLPNQQVVVASQSPDDMWVEDLFNYYR